MIKLSNVMIFFYVWTIVLSSWTIVLSSLFKEMLTLPHLKEYPDKTI